MSTTDEEVAAAAGLLVEEFGRALDDVKEQAAAAFDTNRFDDARNLADQAEAVAGLIDRVRQVNADWDRLAVNVRVGVADAPGDTPPEPDGEHSRRYLGRVARGSRTPEAAFRVPILLALEDAGGTAPMGDVIERVGELMDADLNDVDRQGLPSDADMIRWRNTAPWSRNELVKAGLMEPSRERGMWEISDAGRALLVAEGHEL